MPVVRTCDPRRARRENGAEALGGVAQIQKYLLYLEKEYKDSGKSLMDMLLTGMEKILEQPRPRLPSWLESLIVDERPFFPVIISLGNYRGGPAQYLGSLSPYTEGIIGCFSSGGEWVNLPILELPVSRNIKPLLSHCTFCRNYGPCLTTCEGERIRSRRQRDMYSYNRTCASADIGWAHMDIVREAVRDFTKRNSLELIMGVPARDLTSSSGNRMNSIYDQASIHFLVGRKTGKE